MLNVSGIERLDMRGRAAILESASSVGGAHGLETAQTKSLGG
jgi:hypothetical protein